MGRREQLEWAELEPIRNMLAPEAAQAWETVAENYWSSREAVASMLFDGSCNPNEICHALTEADEEAVTLRAFQVAVRALLISRRHELPGDLPNILDSLGVWLPLPPPGVEEFALPWQVGNP